MITAKPYEKNIEYKTHKKFAPMRLSNYRWLVHILKLYIFLSNFYTFLIRLYS